MAARVVGSLVGQAYGWRVVFIGSAALTLALGLATAYVLPSEKRRGSGPLFAGLAALPGLVRTSPTCGARACARRACSARGAPCGRPWPCS